MTAHGGDFCQHALHTSIGPLEESRRDLRAHKNPSAESPSPRGLHVRIVRAQDSEKYVALWT